MRSLLLPLPLFYTSTRNRYGLLDCPPFTVSFFLGHDLFHFRFLLKMTDITGIIHIAQRCYFLWEIINTMLSVLLVTEACYAINENNNKENQGKLPYFRHKLAFLLAKIGKPILCWHFLWQHKLPFCQRKLKKNLFCVRIFLPRQKKCEYQWLLFPL